MDALTIVTTEASRFAEYLHAYQECTEDVQLLVNEMIELIRNPESTDDEREHAADVMVEALFTKLSGEAGDMFWALSKSPRAQSVRAELDRQENTFSANVRRLMEEKGLTQVQLAELTGVTQPAIANILNRQCRPQQRTVSRIAEALEVLPTDIWPELPTQD